MTNELPLLTIYNVYGDELFQSYTSTHKELLEEAVREGAYLECADLRNLDLRGLVLNNAELQGSTFEGSDLTGAFMSNCNLDGCTFDGCEMTSVYMDDDVTVNETSFSGGAMDVAGGNFACAIMSTPKVVEQILSVN